MSIRVLVVEDEELAAEAHASYVARVPGFELGGVARTAQDALRKAPQADLILLDMNLPDLHGLGVLQRIRAAGVRCDVIAVTAARDAAVVRDAASQGVVAYLLKPFTFAGFRGKLEQYADYHRRLSEVADAAGDTIGQSEVDQLLGARRPSGAPAHLPKGMSPETMQQITAVVEAAGGPLSAGAAGEAIGASRVTARRYLEYLADHGVVRRSVRYGGPGRPEIRYSR